MVKCTLPRQNIKPIKGYQMNPDISSSILPTLSTDLLARADIQVDNLFSKVWRKLGINSLLKQSG